MILILPTDPPVGTTNYPSWVHNGLAIRNVVHSHEDYRVLDGGV